MIRRFARLLLANVGRLQIYLFGFDATLAQTWSLAFELGGLRRFRERAQREAMMAEYYGPATSTERREQIKGMFMGADSGRHWAERLLRSGYYLNPENQPDHFERRRNFVWADELIGSNGRQRVHIVGCSSGQDVAYLAGRHPDVEFEGSDLYDKVVEFCAEQWAEVPNARFRVIDLTKRDDIEAIRSDVVISSGSLAYLDQASLLSLFAILATGTKHLFIGEPMEDPSYVWSETGSRKRSAFLWSHPYGSYLKASGWEVERLEEYRDATGGANAVSIHAVTSNG